MTRLAWKAAVRSTMLGGAAATVAAVLTRSSAGGYLESTFGITGMGIVGPDFRF